MSKKWYIFPLKVPFFQESALFVGAPPPPTLEVAPPKGSAASAYK